MSAKEAKQGIPTPHMEGMSQGSHPVAEDDVISSPSSQLPRHNSWEGGGYVCKRAKCQTPVVMELFCNLTMPGDLKPICDKIV